MENVEIERRWIIYNPVEFWPGMWDKDETVETAFIPSKLGYGPICRFRYKHSGSKDRYFYSIKSEGALVRDELEADISKEQYENLTKGLYKKIVKFAEYPYELNGKHYKLEFKNMGRYLIMEQEFDSVEDAENFDLLRDAPKIFGDNVPHEVTGTKDYNFYNFYSIYMKEANEFYEKEGAYNE